MLNDSDIERLRGRLGQAPQPLELFVHQSADDSPLNAGLRELAEQLVTACEGKVAIKSGDGPSVPASPALSITTAQRRNVHYLAVPEGHQVEPFVEVLLALAAGPSPPEQDWQHAVAALEQPAELLVFTGAACPHCPQAVRAAHQVALANPRVTVSVVDAQRYPSLTERYSVKAVPLTLLDQNFSLVGVVAVEKLSEHILARGTASYEQQLFQSLVDAGRLDEVAERLGTESGLACFVAAWRESTTSTRMGLLVMVEDLLEADRQALDEAVGELLPALDSEDAALQGDTADLLGRIGLEAAAEPLRRLLDHSNPDVAEIASEALEEIEQRSSQ